MNVTKEIFNYWKHNDFNTLGIYRISKRTYQKIRSVDTYVDYKKKYCNKKPINPIQKTYVNFQKDTLKTRSVISKLIILDIAITIIGIAFLIALIAW